MEIQFEEPKKSLRPKRSNTFKGGNKKSERKNKFVGVRQRPSGRYVAEIKDTTQNIRMWLGTFETAEEAAKAYDEAATLLRGSNTRTNFVTHVSYDSPLASRIKNLLNNREKDIEKQVEEDLKVRNNTTNHDNTINSNTNRISISNTTNSANTISGSTNNIGASCVTNTSITVSSTTNTSDIVSGTTDSTGGANSVTSTSTTLSNNNIDGNIGNSIFSVMTMQSTRLFDDAYRPDMSNFNEYESSYNKSNVSWDFGPIFDNFPIGQGLDMVDELGVSEFERMKVERQISASLYAINGVHEYMENFQDCNEALWNLSPFCSFLCSNNTHQI
ncbi:unnamed protein product [Lathyrus sativus]|nr:unnamed protein product [Lathyrus sativus]